MDVLKFLVALAVTFACGVPLGILAGMCSNAKMDVLWAVPFGLVLIAGVAVGGYIMIPKH